MKTVDVPKSSF